MRMTAICAGTNEDGDRFLMCGDGDENGSNLCGDGWGWGQGLVETIGDGFRVHGDGWRWG